MVAPFLLRQAARRIWTQVAPLEADMLVASFGKSSVTFGRRYASSRIRRRSLQPPLYSPDWRRSVVRAPSLQEQASRRSILKLPLVSAPALLSRSVAVGLPAELPLVRELEPSRILSQLPEIQLQPRFQLMVRALPRLALQAGGALPPRLVPEENRRRRDGRKAFESQSYLRANALVTKVWDRPSEVLDFYRAFAANSTLEGGILAWQVSQFMDQVMAKESQVLKQQLYDTGVWPFPVGVQRLNSLLQGRHLTPWGF